jgi:hypothetical protein
MRRVRCTALAATITLAHVGTGAAVYAAAPLARVVGVAPVQVRQAVVLGSRCPDVCPC